MPYREIPCLPAPQVHPICLDYGTDETLGSVSFSESESGFSLKSRWQFTVGTELALDCKWCDARFGPKRVSIAGIVVGCERCAESTYETIVFLLEALEPAKCGFHEVAHRQDD